MDRGDHNVTALDGVDWVFADRQPRLRVEDDSRASGGVTARHDVAIVHDYLTQRGGAERVVLAMADAFPGAPIYTSLYEPDTTFSEFRDLDVRPLWTNRIGALRRDHRRGLPIYPLAFSSTTVDARVTLCSSSGFAHGVRTTGRKVVYCYTPPRWLYDEADTYLAHWSPPIRLAARALSRSLRAWDQRAAHSADETLTSSTAVRDRISRVYGIDARVLAPPVHADIDGEQRPVPGMEPGFLLSIGRLLAYKNVDAVSATMAELPEHHLVVAGAGPERARLEGDAGSNVTFLGEVDEAQLRWLYTHSAGLICASFEDYGLTTLEAAAYGCPTAALHAGGYLDTVVEGVTGAFFDEPVPTKIAPAIRAMVEHDWDADALRRHAAKAEFNSFPQGLQGILADGPAGRRVSSVRSAPVNLSAQRLVKTPTSAGRSGLAGSSGSEARASGPRHHRWH
jgi:glycosyltransferase involved in cell wall biosynthesis